MQPCPISNRIRMGWCLLIVAWLTKLSVDYRIVGNNSHGVDHFPTWFVIDWRLCGQPIRSFEGNSHYDDVIMSAIASQITSLDSDVDQRKHQSSASLAFVWEIHWGPVNSPHKYPVMRKMFPFDDVIMHEVNRDFTEIRVRKANPRTTTLQYWWYYSVTSTKYNLGGTRQWKMIEYLLEYTLHSLKVFRRFYVGHGVVSHGNYFGMLSINRPYLDSLKFCYFSYSYENKWSHILDFFLYRRCQLYNVVMLLDAHQ